ncbi:pentatricopeptide repeat-containing protein At4g30825, chloroplastic-like [Rutidosis leptorrhynchoides]|uniref:pentatricopeptide repeat-containing protein At4g30825, chloroplastic-like n=1 Tax=Rutidosis leptorrhynchoides TaxID=125765 RepID=UPI003A996AC8
MASFTCYIHLDTFESKKPNSVVPFSDRGLIFAFTSINNNTFSKFKHPRVSKLGADVLLSNNVDRPVDLNDDNVILRNRKLYGEVKKGKRSIWKRLDGLKNVSKDPKAIGNLRNDNRNDKEIVCDDDSVVDLLDNNGVFLENLGYNGAESSLGECNIVLEKLESDGRDDEALRFFEWMRENGKLMRNVNAYKLVLRVLGRRQDWDGAERLIEEMEIESCCELSFHVFNTVIYACHRKGIVAIGTKWFKMMLSKGVQPNVATFGMVMSLYQKCGVIDEAEFAFSHMRKLNIVCPSAYSAMITMYTRIGLYEKAEEVIGYLRKDKVIMNRENWLVFINAYSQQGKLDEAEKELEKMNAAGFVPHIVAYNTIITGYGKVSKMLDAERIFRNLVSVGLKPDESTYRTMVEGWGRVQNFKEAEKYYKEMIRLGYKPNSSNLYTMINLQAKYGDEAGAIRTINDMVTIGCQLASVLGILLQAYEKAERFERVSSVVKGLLYNHVLNNQTSCSILVMAYVKHGLVDNAIEVLGIKKWKDKVFEDSLYHLLICTCKELGHLDNSIKIYTSMPKRDKPNLHITCTMIDIYSCLNQFTEAETLYLNLKSKGVALDLIAFSIVVRMYVKAGSLNDACSVLDVVEKQKDVVPDVYLFRDMLRIYQRLGMVNKLADLYYKILKADLTWDQEMYNSVINCCARALPIDELSRLFNEMIQRGFSPNTVTYNVMLDVYGKSGLFKKVRQVFWMAKKQGTVDVVSYNTVVAAYGKGKDLGNMASVARRMKFNGFSVSIEAYNCMLDAYGKAGEMEKFKNVLLRMKESNCASDHYTFNILINIYGEKGWIEEVGDVLKELEESELKPDICSYNSLIKAYGIAGMVENAVDLVREMRKNGIEPDRLTYTNLISALQKNDMVLEALKWSLWMKQMGI